jgi:peptidoglycan hydrolase FlgJ
MQSIPTAAAASTHAGRTSSFLPSVINGRPDLDFAAALQKVSPRAQAKAKATATDFEGMFLNSMFAEMTSGLKGEGPFGDTVGTGVWRSMLTEQYSRTFAKAGGVGIASEVYRTLIMQQAKTTSNDTATTGTGAGNATSKSSSQ